MAAVVQLLIFILSLSCPPLTAAETLTLESLPTPSPSPWPEQFHAILYANYSGELSLIDLWYDWPNRRNFNIIQHQLGTLTYDLEWGNGTSFYYTFGDNATCRVLSFEVGILRPNWLDGGNYLGRRSVDGFECDVWEKASFIWYYEDVETRRPVHWRFYTGRSVHVMTFDVGAVLEDEKWQAPVYCFGKEEGETITLHQNTRETSLRGLLSL